MMVLSAERIRAFVLKVFYSYCAREQKRCGYIKDGLLFISPDSVDECGEVLAADLGVFDNQQ